jgi:hypothetical protein
VCRSLAASPTLGECFALFEVLHQITTNHAAIRRIAREALEDFAAGERGHWEAGAGG